MQTMPRFVDPEERRQEIIEASLRRLAEKGPKALTIRGIAEEMGMSVTAVTHYYDNRQAIIEDINRTLDEEWLEELAELRTDHEDPAERLWSLLDWLLPIDEVAQREEKIRMALLAQDEIELIGPARQHFSSMVETEIADCLESLIPGDDVPRVVQTIRVFLSGIVLSCAEYPEEWPPERQRQALADILRLIGLPAGPPSA